jgi:mycoredoxin
MRSWSFAVLLWALGVVAGIPDIVAGSLATGLVILGLAACFGFLLSPLPFPRSLPAAVARERSADDGRPVVYWRPGCRFCLALRLRLGRDAGRAHWVDIWSDPDGAAAVRAVTGGSETVPTVIAGETALVNPGPAAVRALLPSC